MFGLGREWGEWGGGGRSNYFSYTKCTENPKPPNHVTNPGPIYLSAPTYIIIHHLGLFLGGGKGEVGG